MNELRPWLRLLGERRGRLILGALLISATVLAGVGLLSLSGWFITATAVTALAWSMGLAASIDVYIPGGGIRFFALARTVSRYVERVFNHDTVLRLLADLRVRLFDRFRHARGTDRYRFQAAQWLNRLTRDIDTLDNLYLRQLAPPAVALLAIVVVSILIGVFLPGAAIVAALMLCYLWLLGTLIMARWGYRLSQRQVTDADRLRTQAVEQAQGLAELSAWQTLPRHQQQLMDAERSRSGDRYRLQVRTAIGQSLMTLGVQGTVLVVLVIALAAYQREMINGPILVMMPLAVLALGEVFSAFPASFMHWGSTMAAARRLNEQGADNDTQNAAATTAPPEGPVVWDAVSVTLGGHVVFDGLSLYWQPGEKLAVVGPSGCGKSTLADLVTGLLRPDAGRITLGGVPLEEVDTAIWRDQLGVLSQQAHLFNDTVAANLRLAAPQAGDDALWTVLDRVGLGETIRRLPRGLETPVGESGRQFSGGEARRLGLARIFLKAPPWVVLDEPLTGLDDATADRVLSTLDEFLASRSALLLAHQPEVLPSATRTLRMTANGKLSAAASAQSE